MKKLGKTYTLPAKLRTLTLTHRAFSPGKVHISRHNSGDDYRTSECGQRNQERVLIYVPTADICLTCLRARFGRWITTELEL